VFPGNAVILETLQEQTGLWITSHNLRRTMATEIGMKAQMKQLTRLFVAGAVLHHAKGWADSVVCRATEGYLMNKASALQPLFVERESRLRKFAALPAEGENRGGMACGRSKS
jgi:hypothetical protein